LGGTGKVEVPKLLCQTKATAYLAAEADGSVQIGDADPEPLIALRTRLVAIVQNFAQYHSKIGT